jgi:hypothetical protein
MCACGSGGPPGARVKPMRQLETAAVPAELLGLEVQREDMASSLRRARPSYADSTSLYSLRNGDLLVATLQLSRMADAADAASPAFRRAVVNQIGSTAPKAMRMGDTTVWLTAGTRQRIAVWFNGRYMFVLASRDDFDQPRVLLRTALQITP